MKARDNKPATSKAIGTPFIPFGIFTRSRYSRILEKTMIARPNPMALAMAKTRARAVEQLNIWVGNGKRNLGLSSAQAKSTSPFWTKKTAGGSMKCGMKSET